MVDYRAALESDGLAIVPGFLNPRETADLTGFVNKTYEVFARSRAFPDPTLEENYVKWNGIWLEPLDQLLEQEQRDLLPEYHRLMGLVSGRARDHFGRGNRLYPHRSYFRRQEGRSKKVAWHVDAEAAAIARPKSFNVWVPLDNVGERLPSLEVVPKSHVRARSEPQRLGYDHGENAAYVATFGPSIAPKLAPGDALVFDQYTLHRTQDVPDGAFTRTACEFRFEGVTARLRFGEFRQSVVRRLVGA